MKNCPICNKTLNKDYSSIDGGVTSEYSFSCPEQHYNESFAYGYTEFSFDDGFHTGFSYRDTLTDIFLVIKSVEKHGKSWRVRLRFVGKQICEFLQKF